MVSVGQVSNIVEATRNEAVTVAATSTRIADQRNAKLPRKVLHIRNISSDAAAVITVVFGFSPAVATYGIVLAQNEAITDTSEVGYDCWQGAITAIVTGAASGTVAIFER